MKKIFCPTDFSETANNAIAYSAKLAKKIGAAVTLFNVQSLANLTLQEAFMGEGVNAAIAGKRLEEQRDEVQKVFKISCEAEVATSVASVVSLIGATGSDYDLIVMGSKGPDDLRHLLLGSNTYQVIRTSSIPLLLIPQGCAYSEVRTIVYAFDYWHTGELPLAQLVAWAKTLGADLRVLQVTEEPYSRKAEEEILAKQEAFLDLYKDEIPISYKTIYAADMVDGLDGYMLRSKSEMLALYAGHQGFLKKVFHKSVIRELSSKATYPLFIFHA
jgi:nucleotide-binding universal stress UspA family protein